MHAKLDEPCAPGNCSKNALQRLSRSKTSNFSLCPPGPQSLRIGYCARRGLSGAQQPAEPPNLPLTTATPATERHGWPSALRTVGIASLSAAAASLIP